MTDDLKPLADLIAEVDAAVAQYRDAVDEELDFDWMVAIASKLSDTMLDAWPRVSAALRILLADDALHRKYRSQCEAENAQLRATLERVHAQPKPLCDRHDPSGNCDCLGVEVRRVLGKDDQ